MLEIEQGSPRQIQTAITFNSDVYLGASHIETLEIEHESSHQIQTSITFDSGV